MTAYPPARKVPLTSAVAVLGGTSFVGACTVPFSDRAAADPPLVCVNGRLIDVGACFYHEYVGEVRLMEMGKLGARGTKRSAERDFRFRGW